MIPRGLNVAEETLQTETAIKTLTANDFHGPGDNPDGVRLTRNSKGET
jgi:hypothetical protein